MPEIKNTFTLGKMNKDLDERIVPNGQYRDAMNIEVATSEGSGVGTVQNLLGNYRVEDIIPEDCRCVGSIADEKNNKLYWFIKKEFSISSDQFDAIIEYDPDFGTIVPVLVDAKAGTASAVLKFPNKIITGINIIDDLLFFTDGVNEPRKINIKTCKAGTPLDALSTTPPTHTTISFDKGSFNCAVVQACHSVTYSNTEEHVGAYGTIYKDHLDKAIGFELIPQYINDPNAVQPTLSESFNIFQYRDDELIYSGAASLFLATPGSDVTGATAVTEIEHGFTMKRDLDPTNSNNFMVGDLIFGQNIAKDIEEKHITVVKQRPKKTLSVKIKTVNVDDPYTEPLFEKILPRFSYRYKYQDNEYSAFAPFTNVVLNPLHKQDYTKDNAYSSKEPYNTSMANIIDSIEVSDFIGPDTPEDVVQVDILYKQEDSNVVYSIASIRHKERAWHDVSRGDYKGGHNNLSNLAYNLGAVRSASERQIIYGGNYKGRYVVNSENIYAAVPEDQLLRTWDNVPRKALAQELTSNRLVFGNYTQGYNLYDLEPKLKLNYEPRTEYPRGFTSFDTGGLPSIKSQRNYQLGVVFGDKYGRETPVLTSNDSAIKIPWRNDSGQLSASQTYQLRPTLLTDTPNWVDYYKFYIKENSGEYYNLLMEKAYIPGGSNTYDELKEHIYLAFPSSDRNKVKVEDYLILKKKVGVGEQQVPLKNKFKILDIQNEAPDAVKYEYQSLGAVSNGGAWVNGREPQGQTNYLTTQLFQNNTTRPVIVGSTTNGAGTTRIELSYSAWIDARGTYSYYSDEDRRQSLTDEEGGLFFSFFRYDKTTGHRKNSSKYRISSITNTNNKYRLTLERAITTKDLAISHDSPTFSNSDLHADLVVQVEQRIKRPKEVLSGKFFVKIANDTSTYLNSFSTDDLLLGNYAIAGVQNVFWAADQISNDPSLPETGIVNSTSSWTTSTDSGHTVKGNTSGSNLSNTETDWSAIMSTLNNDTDNVHGGVFAIDNMHMVAGQLSDNNFAKNASQTWVGSGCFYPYNPVWIGDNKEAKKENTLTSVIGNSNNIRSGWYHHRRNVGTWYGNGGSSSNGYRKDRAVNGLEGIVTTTSAFTDRRINSADEVDSPGYKVWKYDGGTGTQYSEYYLDKTYGDSGDEGKFFIHLSFFSPGVNLVTAAPPGTSIVPSSPNFVGKYLEGIWGGGVFTPLTTPSDSYDNSFGTGVDGNNNWHEGFPLEGKSVYMNSDPEPNVAPGPGVKNSVGYDLAYADRHYNQWNPAYPDDPDGQIQNFINNIKEGSKFKFRDDDKNTVYTIKKVSVKKLYNHTPWRTRYHYDSNTNDLAPAGDSVEESAMIWADTLDSSGNGGDATKRSNFKDKIFEFGKANNRRVCYIIEVDKNPKDQTYNPVKGNASAANSNLTFAQPGAIEFITNDPNAVLLNNLNKPAIFETEPSQQADLNIYYEASHAIPTKINQDTRELFAPVGCRVEIVGLPEAYNGINHSGELLVVKEQNYLAKWANPNGFDGDGSYDNWNYDVYPEHVTERNFVVYPGFCYMDSSGIEIDYSGAEVRFYREDGSYTSALLAIQQADPSFQGDFKTIFALEPKISPRLEMGLNWYNCFCFGNGVESNRIRDGFNETFITNGARASSIIEEPYEEDNRKSGLIYSGIYNSISGINNLNQFIIANNITKDLNPTYGSIQKLFQRKISLIAFCEDRVVGITAGKDTLFNADGNPQIIASNKVLGDASPFVGDYGISKNPESFAKESYRAYFTDKQRGAVLRLSMDGLTPISDAGMHDWFRDNLKEPNELIGSYDAYKKDYNLTLARIYTENLLRNSDISEGEELILASPITPEIIENGTTNNGTPVTTNFNVYNMNVEDRNIQSITEIKHHSAISAGSIQAFVAGEPAVAQRDPQFVLQDQDLLNENYLTGISHTHDPNIPVDHQPPTSSDSYPKVTSLFKYDNSSNGNGTNAFRSLGTAYPFKSGNPYSMSYNDYGVAKNTNGYSWLKTINGDTTITFGTPSQTRDWNHFQWDTHLYDTYSSSPIDGNSYILYNPVDTDMFTVPNYGYTGIICEGWSKASYRDANVNILLPYEVDGGIWPTSLISSDVTSWFDGGNHSFSSLQWNAINVAGSFQNAHDWTMFAGEEIVVQVKIRVTNKIGYNYTPGYVYSTHPLSGSQNDTNDADPELRIKLFDGTTAVPDSSIHNPQGSGTTYGNQDSLPFGRTAFSPGTDSAGFQVGFQDAAQYDFPPCPRPAYVVYEDFTLRAYFKFKGTTDNQEEIVVNQLNIKLAPRNSGQADFEITDILIRKKYAFTEPGRLAYAGVPDIPNIPAATVPAWAEVRHNHEHWAVTDLNGMQFLKATRFDGGISDYGPENPASTDSAFDNNGNMQTWTIGNDNGVTTHDPSATQNTWLAQPMQADEITFEPVVQGSTGNWCYFKNANMPAFTWHSDKFYMVDVIVTDYVGGNIYVRGVADAQGYGSWDNTVDQGDTDYPDGHLGQISAAWQNAAGTDRRIKLVNITDLDPTSSEDNLIRYTNSGIEVFHWSGVSGGVNNKKIFRAVFKVTSNSNVIYNNLYNKFHFQLVDFEGKIDWANAINISDIPTGGTMPKFEITNASNTLINSFSRPYVFYENGKINFRRAPFVDNKARQKFDDPSHQSGVSIAKTLPRTSQGYELRFNVSNFTTGKLMIDLRGDYDSSFATNPFALRTALGSSDINPDHGDGDYVFQFNPGDGTNLTSYGYQTKNGLPIVGGAIYIYNDAQWGTVNNTNKNMITLHSDWTLGTNSSILDDLTCSITNLSIRSLESIFVGGSVDSWDFVGFNPIINNYVSFDSENGVININNAPISSFTGGFQGAEIEQVINKKIKTGTSYRIRFNYSISTGKVIMYYFNHDAQGFRTQMIDATNGLQEGYYDEVHVIGDEIQNSDGGNVGNGYGGSGFNEKLLTFGIHFRGAQGDLVNGTLDNFSMQEEFPLFEPKTISFSEDVKGWVSFKSFAPENGLSLSKEYYTINNGQLWQHYREFDDSGSIIPRNSFYDTIVESSITAVLNTQPSLVKIFNTLNYEGSQSKINQYNQDHTSQTIKSYNITGKDGWYVESIITNKQEGSISEFIEKEGKWFNYIRGRDQDVKTADLSFQGLGIISGVNVVSGNRANSSNENITNGSTDAAPPITPNTTLTDPPAPNQNNTPQPPTPQPTPTPSPSPSPSPDSTTTTPSPSPTPPPPAPSGSGMGGGGY